MFKKLFISLFLISAVSTAHPVFAIADFDAQFRLYEQALEESNRKEAERLARSLHDLGPGEFGDDSEEMAELALNLGASLDKIGATSTSRELLQEARQRYRSIDKEHPQLVEVHLALGRNWSKGMAEEKKARREYTRAIKLAGEIYGKDSVEKALVETRVGANLLEISRSPRAGRYLESAWETLNNELGDANQSTGEAAFYRGKYELSKENNTEAELWFRRALATFQSDAGAPPALELTSRAFLVAALERQEKSEEATEHCLAIGRMSPSNPDQQREPLFKTKLDAVSLLKNGAVSKTLLAENDGKGVIAFEFTVDEMGFVRDPRVIENNLGDDFKRAGLETISSFRYAPRFEDGEPVPSTDTYELTFELIRMRS